MAVITCGCGNVGESSPITNFCESCYREVEEMKEIIRKYGIRNGKVTVTPIVDQN